MSSQRSTTTSLWYAKDAEPLKYRQLYPAKESDGSGGRRVHDASSCRRDAKPPTRERGRPSSCRSGRLFTLRQPDLADDARRADDRLPCRVSTGEMLSACDRAAGRPTRQGMERLLHARSRACASATRSATFGTSTTSRLSRLHNVWDDTVTSGFADDKIYVVQTNTKVIERCMLMTTDPGDLVLDPTCGSGTTALRRRAVGATVDHDRHVARRARARAPAADGRAVPLLPARRLAPRAARRSSRSPARRCRRQSSTDDIRHGLRLRAGAAHHAEVDRQQPRHQGGDEPRGDRRGDQAARRLRAALRQAVRGHARRSASPGRSRSRACRRTARSPFARRARSRARETEAAKDADAPNFEQTILDNLAKAGIQNGRRQGAARRSTSSSPTPATYIQADRHPRGRRRTATPQRVGDRDRPAVRHRQPVVHQEGGARGDQRRGRRPALRPRLRLRPAGRSASPSDGVTVERPTRASPTSPPSAGSAGSRCCSCG